MTFQNLVTKLYESYTYQYDKKFSLDFFTIDDYIYSLESNPTLTYFHTDNVISLDDSVDYDDFINFLQYHVSLLGVGVRYENGSRHFIGNADYLGQSLNVGIQKVHTGNEQEIVRLFSEKDYYSYLEHDIQKDILEKGLDFGFFPQILYQYE